MKEFSFGIEETFQLGLRRDYRQKANTLLFTEMINIEPTPYGAAPFSYVTLPWGSDQLSMMGISLDFPFPQLIRLHKFTLLMGADYMFTVNENDWTLQQVTTYNFHSLSDAKSIPTGSYWQIADFWDTFVLTNGSCALWYDRITDKVLVEDTVRFQAVSDYKGRAVFGGFNPDFHWSSKWVSYWNTLNSSIVGGTPRALDQNWIKWTAIGQGLKALINADQTQLDRLKNDFGDMPMEDRSLIAGIKKLDKDLMIYSLNSGTVVSHVSNPISTIGIKSYELCPGILNVGAVDGDRNNHVFISSSREVWWIDKSFRTTRLGYQEFIDKMTGDVIVSFNPITKGFYISSQDRTYTLTWNLEKNQPQGLAEAKQRITSCISDGSVAFGLGSEFDVNAGDIKWSMLTDETDFKRPGDKSIRWITFFGSESSATVGSVQARVHSRIDYRKQFSQTAWKTINAKGACYFPIVGERFKIELKGDSFTDINIHHIEVSIQQGDNRFTRGLNVNQVNS